MNTESQIKYVATENIITFYKDNEVRTVTKDSNFLFAALRESLINNESKYINLVDHPKDFLLDAIKDKLDFLGLNKRVQSLEEQNLPIEPLLTFVRRLPDSLIKQNPGIVTKAGTNDLPLTWDGNLVAYQRAAWLPMQGASRTAWTKSFEPFRTIESQDKNIVVAEFTWTQEQCPDTGTTFEVIVQPEHITNQQQSKGSGVWYASAVTQLNKLGEHLSSDQKATTGIVEFASTSSNLGDSETPMVVRLPYNAGTASKLISSLFSPTYNTQGYNNIARIPVRVGVGGC